MESRNLAVILAFRQDRANRLPEQTQRRMYGGVARARRHGGGIVKIFHWEGEPQQEFNTATTMSLYTLQLIIRITVSTYSGATPFFLYSIIYTVRHPHVAKPYLAGGRPKPLKPTYLLPLYTLIHLAHSNILTARVLGLSIP